MKNQIEQPLLVRAGVKEAAEVATQPKPLYFYGTKTEKSGNKIITRRVTFAGIQVSKGAIRVGKAVCSLKDPFVKKKGRSIALGRALSKTPENIIYLNGDEKPEFFFIKNVSKLLDKNDKKAKKD